MPRGHAPNCPSCKYYWSGKRLYHRAPSGRGYTPIGWICPKCGHTWLDRAPLDSEDYLPRR